MENLVNPEQWDKYRRMADSIGDVRAMFKHAQERANDALDNIRDCPADPELGSTAYDRIQGARKSHARWQSRANTLGVMLEVAFERGEVPAYGDLAETENPHGIKELAHFLPNSTLETAKRDQKMYQEFWGRREKGEGAAELKQELSSTYNCSEKTVESVVYPKNT